MTTVVELRNVHRLFAPQRKYQQQVFVALENNEPFSPQDAQTRVLLQIWGGAAEPCSASCTIWSRRSP